MSILNPITCNELGDRDSPVSHGFFTREGGTSSGIYRGLNVGLGSRDDQQSVAANRARVAKSLGVPAGRLATLYQTHSPDVIVVREPIGPQRPKADSIVTATPGLAIGILTADCGPVLFCDAQKGVIAAAHAGWQGATGGVLENTILAMESLGANRTAIRATLGPTICQENYEVGPEFVERLMKLHTDNQKYLVPSDRTGHALFDLPNYIVDRLTASGVTAKWTGHCTYADEDRFFSYRRTTHRNEPDYGRQISAIALTS